MKKKLLIPIVALAFASVFCACGFAVASAERTERKGAHCRYVDENCDGVCPQQEECAQQGECAHQGECVQQGDCGGGGQHHGGSHHGHGCH